MAHFYMVGFFTKGLKSGVMFMREKPFEFDTKEGTVTGKCICTWPPKARKPRNEWPMEWFYCSWAGLKDIDTDKYLQETLNETWQRWCKNHKRKYTPLFALGK